MDKKNPANREARGIKSVQQGETPKVGSVIDKPLRVADLGRNAFFLGVRIHDGVASDAPRVDARPATS